MQVLQHTVQPFVAARNVTSPVAWYKDSMASKVNAMAQSKMGRSTFNKSRAGTEYRPHNTSTNVASTMCVYHTNTTHGPVPCTGYRLKYADDSVDDLI